MSSILLDHFYTIDKLQKEESIISSRIHFDIDHPIFQGHFPDMPIIPGVCQAQILAEVMSQSLGANLHLTSAASIKFLSIIDPTKHPKIDLIINYTQNESSYSVTALYKWEETVFFKFKGIFAAVQ
jgi:3-hydroxyacyl-[acyl-carrier-protein] dehydratase